jgi:protein-disulfide isomerase
MHRLAVRLGLAFALFTVPALRSTPAQEAWFPIKAANGSLVANHRVPVELESQIEQLPGVVTVGNPQGDVTLVEFYDLNCPYCRAASADVAALLERDKGLRLILVAFPVLGVPSILASRVELAVRKISSPQQFYQFHRNAYAGRGVIDGERALAVARELGLERQELIAAANDDETTETMKAHVALGNALGLFATPAFVIKGVAIVGHPGGKTLDDIVTSIRRCDKVVC